ncbi:MAG: hypothetical protein LAN83_00955 [Acidobacteriia bacterium]|nr:hypothetical protein [Terriglobia bacterium]
MNCLRQIRRWLVLTLLLSAALSAQVYRINAGSTDQYDASGGSIEVTGGRFTSGFGLGSIDGGIRFGAFVRTRVRAYDVTLGDQTVMVDLPTDLFGSGQQVDIRGMSVGANTAATQELIFAGFKSVSYGAPFFRAAEGKEPVGIILYSHRWNDKLKFYSRNLFSGEKTSIQGLEYRANDWLKLTSSAGIGSGKPYGAIAANADFHQFAVKAAYILQGNNFRRVQADGLAVSEPIGANIDVNWKASSRISTDFSHMQLNGLVLKNSTLPAATMDTASVNWTDRHFRASAAVFTSTAQNVRSNAFSLSAGRKIRNWGEVDVNWLQSKPVGNRKATNSLITTFREYLSPRLELAQFVTRGDGNTTASFGGNLIGNRLSVGLEYQTIYVPYVPAKPFTQAAVINIRLRPFGNVELNGGTGVGADGKVRYTAWGNTLMVRNDRYQQTPAAMTIPKYIIRGHVADESGKPIRGAALRIGKELTFTDSDGLFFVRASKRSGVPVEVAFDEFLASGNWEKVTVPESANPELEEHAVELEVVLRRHTSVTSRQTGLDREGATSLGGGN